MIRSTDHKVVQQRSEVRMLNAELKRLRKQHEQMVDIHTRCKSQEHISTTSQTDQVAKYCKCCEFMALMNVMGSNDPYNFYVYLHINWIFPCT